MKSSIALSAVLLLGLMVSGVQADPSNMQGTVKAGYVYTDLEGDQGINQSTYNLYEGAALSLEGFRYSFDNGFRLFGDLKNVTLNNRHITVGATKSGFAGATLRHNKYRRVYSFDGGTYTRRERTNGDFWWQAHKYVRIYGGAGRTERAGDVIELFDPAGSTTMNTIDYGQTFYHAGVRLKRDRSYLNVEYRGSDYTDDANELNDRKSTRIKIIAATPMPRYENLLLSGGFQHYENQIENRSDSLIANTVWGAARFFYGKGYHANYSVMFDRARRTGDFTATDNIIHSLYAGKTWRQVGGFTVGYRHRTTDDVQDDLSADGYAFSGWLKVATDLTVKAGYGAESTEVQAGRTLTGDADVTRHWGQVKYTMPQGFVRAKFESRSRENEDIGSKTDYTRLGGDVSLSESKYGRFMMSYAYLMGEYENDAGLFEFEQHVISGDLMSAEYRHLRGGLGGVYSRSKKDLDIESFTLRLTGAYQFRPGMTVEAIYSAVNFDDLADPSPIYTRYYTANILEINLQYEL